MAAQPSDRYVTQGVYLSYAAAYGSQYKDKARVVLAIAVQALPILRELLDVPANVSVRIAPIKARRTNGRYYNGDNIAEIDCRLGWEQALAVLCHEMVHAEQYHTGRLSSEYVRSKGFVHKWNGSLDFNKGSTYKAYREQPWEVEAFERQNQLAAQVNEILNARLAGKE